MLVFYLMFRFQTRVITPQRALSYIIWLVHLCSEHFLKEISVILLALYVHKCSVLTFNRYEEKIKFTHQILE
jgi:hypothetical protein